MSTPIWPLTLPQKPQRTNYSWKQPSCLLRSDMDTGPAKIRARGKNKPIPESMVFVMTTEQVDNLQTFVKETLAGGSICFDFPHPVKNRLVRARFVPQSESMFEVQPWKNTLVWQVSFTLEMFFDAPV